MPVPPCCMMVAQAFLPVLGWNFSQLPREGIATNMRLTAIYILLMSCVAPAQDGRVVFAARCSVCHGDGHGTERGPNLANNRRVRSRSLGELQAVIRDGLPASGMPAFRLPTAELDAVTAYVRSLSAPAAEANAPGNRAAGEQYFFGKGGCAACHMALGRGKAVGPDLSTV